MRSNNHSKLSRQLPLWVAGTFVLSVCGKSALAQASFDAGNQWNAAPPGAFLQKPAAKAPQARTSQTRQNAPAATTATTAQSQSSAGQSDWQEPAHVDSSWQNSGSQSVWQQPASQSSAGQSAWQKPAGAQQSLGQSDWQQPASQGQSSVGQSAWQKPAAPSQSSCGQSEWQQPGQSQWQQSAPQTGSADFQQGTSQPGQSDWQNPSQSQQTSAGGIGQSEWQNPAQQAAPQQTQAIGQSEWQNPSGGVQSAPALQGGVAKNTAATLGDMMGQGGVTTSGGGPSSNLMNGGQPVGQFNSAQFNAGQAGFGAPANNMMNGGTTAVGTPGQFSGFSGGVGMPDMNTLGNMTPEQMMMMGAGALNFLQNVMPAPGSSGPFRGGFNTYAAPNARTYTTTTIGSGTGNKVTNSAPVRQAKRQVNRTVRNTTQQVGSMTNSMVQQTLMQGLNSMRR
jgi:hypothetical protein